MLGKFIEIESGEVAVKPVCWTIGPLRDVIDFYPETYSTVMQYLHSMVSLNPFDNPFADIDENLKTEVVLRALKLDIDSTSDIIKEALEIFTLGYETPTYRSYLGLKRLLDQVNRKLGEVEVDFEKDGNAVNVNNTVKSLSMYKKEMKEARKEYLEEQGTLRGRGGLDMAYDENAEDDEEDDYGDNDNMKFEEEDDD